MNKLHRRAPPRAVVGLQTRAVAGAGGVGLGWHMSVAQKNLRRRQRCFRGDQTLRGPRLRESPCVAVVTGCKGSPTTASGRCFGGKLPHNPPSTQSDPALPGLRNRQLGCDPSEPRPLSSSCTAPTAASRGMPSRVTQRPRKHTSARRAAMATVHVQEFSQDNVTGYGMQNFPEITPRR